MWICDEDRFNWYCDLPPDVEQAEQSTDKPVEKPPATDEEDEAVAALKALREDVERKRALAIIKPTPENLKRYIVAQEALMDRASVFSDVWRRVIWANPELNYQLRNPSNNAAIQVRDSQRSRKASETLAGLAGEWGLFFFFRSDCPYCHRIAPTLKWLSEQYGIAVFPISLDGGGLPEFPQPSRDNGMAATLGVSVVPLVVLGNVKDRRLLPIGSGVLSAQEIVERIYILTQTRPGELY
ncbi:conjugal transfer protein TraF [Candidatus Accumulibacter sp. ACC007]|uniref:conjugal transfer protein TraF n=1 Tax=Candidatus Accumulibacter sp. ACC007 TaxID=2823333 RepID=UPI0025B815DE|nr:conjugal transfer protein TraF [Candidatus Accumulibacter sp. ACC007]